MTIATGITLPETELAEICGRYQIKELSLFTRVQNSSYLSECTG